MATADTQILFYGFWHLAGSVVRVSILGLDCGTYTVSATGLVTVPYASDAGGLLTPAYLVANSNSLTGVEQNLTFSVTTASATTSVTVPVVIGLDYTTQGQVLRPDVAADIHSPLGPGLGKTRRGHMMSAFVQDAIAIKFGTDFTSATQVAARFTTNGATLRAEDSPYTGVYWDLLSDGYSFDGMLSWQVNRPYPCTVVSVSTFLETAER